MAERGAWFQSTQLNTSYTTTNPQCSCPRCDSMQCFSRRQAKAACSCQKCNNSKTCLSFPQKMDTTKDDARTTAVKTPMEGDITAKEQVKREITYERPENDKTQSKVKIVKKTMFSGDKESREIENSDHSEHSINIPIGNEDVNISGKERCSSAAKLSAQIMNIPYQDMLDDLSNKQSHSSYKISAYDVLKRIRDAYKACSCKVCECLVGKSLAPKNELCKCEPCDCNDCMSYLTKFQYLGRYEKQVPEGCPCVRCDRSQCKALNKNNPQSCDCRRNSSLESSTSFAKSCECQPCQCLECKGLSFGVPRSLVVAPVGEQHQHVYCQCTPCECIECRGYGIASGFARETATSVNRHPCCHCEVCTNEACIPDGSESCRCERLSKVVKKPIEKDVRDYDIHAMVTSDKVLRNAKNKPVKNSMIALYATVPNTYKKKGYKKECSCTICECVVCNCKENTVDSIKSSQLFQKPCKNLNIPNFNTDACKCSPCECETLCSKKEEFKIMAKTCKCDICSCLNCVGIRNVDNIKTCPYVNAIKLQSKQQLCKCGPCECVDCNKNNTCAGDECKCAICSCEQCDHENKESIYPIKKANVFTPSTYTHEMLKEANTHRYHTISTKDYCKNVADVKLYDSSKETQRDIFSYHAHPHNYRFIEKMEYILPPGKKTLLHPKTDNGDFKTKARIVSHGNSGMKYSTHNDSRNIYRQNCDNDNVQSPSILSADSLSMNLADSSGYSTVSPALVEEDLCENSCDSGCGSLDYYTILPESGVKSTKVGEQYIKDQNATYIMSPENKNDILTVLTEKDYINENQEHHHHSFESDNQNYTNTNDNYCSTSQSGIFNGITTANERIYDQKFWIKNVDVSLNLQELDFNKDKQKYFLDNVSKNHLRNDRNLQNTAEDSDISLPISRNIGDYSLNSRDQRGEDSFNNEGYYEGVQKTLHRARAFSLQLMKILDKYERANNEFQSITQKLKISHASLINKNELEEHGNNVRKSSSVRHLSERDFHHEKHKYHDNAKEETHTRPDIFKDLQTKTAKDQFTQVDKSLTVPKLLCYQNTCVLDMEKIRRLEDFYNNFKEKDSKKSLNSLLTLSERKIGGFKKSNKSSSNILKQLIMLSKGSHKNNVTSPVKKSDRLIQTSNVSQSKEQTAVHSSSFSRDDDTERLDLTDTRCLDLMFPILKKNYYLQRKAVARNKGICIFPTMQRDVKQLVRSISMQTTIGNGYLPHKNVALQNLKAEVRNLLDMPILQHSQMNNNFDFKIPITSQTQTKIDVLMASECQTNKEIDHLDNVKYNPVNYKSTKSCCDALKVNFLSLRRVSDHTVLVKWNAPRETTDVAGYELLVDGRAVQKILSPLRCVAVVTCLPHCETILLTIRTITSLTPSGHYPSSTVVYHPRAKEQ